MELKVPAAILAERVRQVAKEGFTKKHDDEHDNGELLIVARMYWQMTTGVVLRMHGRPGSLRTVPVGFPWDDTWWKPKSPARDLERAGALCLAEIDRLKRKGVSPAHAEEQLKLIVDTYNGLAG